MAGRTANSLETILTYENRDLSQWSVQWSTTHIPGMDNASGRPRRREAGRRRLRLGSLALGGLLTMHCRVAASALTGGLFVFLLFFTTAVGTLASPIRHFEVYLGQWSISGPGRAFRIIPMLDGIGIAICINAIVRAINCCFIAAIAMLYVMHSVSDADLPFTYCRDFNLKSYKPIIKNMQLMALQEAGLILLNINMDAEAAVEEEYYVGRKAILELLSKWQMSFEVVESFTNCKLPMLMTLLGHLIPPKGCIGKKWKFSTAEAIEGLLIHVKSRFSMEAGMFVNDDEHQNNIFSSTVGQSLNAWRNNTTLGEKHAGRTNKKVILEAYQIAVCNEKYSGKYPVLYSTPAYNYFYVEIVHLRDDYSFGQFSTSLVVCNVLIWSFLWALMISERFRYGRLIWNNIYVWFVIIPLIWALVLSTAAISNLLVMKKSFRKVFRVGAKEIFAAIADALEVALYVHSAGVGTEIIHGKGLNHYASGHIDPHLNAENIWHSVLLVFVSGVHCVGATLCTLVDSTHLKTSSTSNMGESTLWIMPMYSQCSSLGNYSHLMTALIFGGLMCSYTTVAFVLIKTALHTIFEYRVKLVFVEQVIVGALILACIGISLPFASNGGIALLESVDALMSGVATSLVCLMELFGLLFVYRAHDFVSDMNISQEETACPTRIDWQWHMIPFITLATICLKGYKLAQPEMPKELMYVALAPVIGITIAVPLRALHNAIVFMRPTPRRGT